MDADVPSELIGDGNRLRRALVEVFGRAARQPEGTEVCLHVSTSNLDGPAERASLRFVVSRQVTKSNNEFRENRTESAAILTAPHLDLGLQLVDAFARRMGGRFSVDVVSRERLEFVFEAAFERVGHAIDAGSKQCPTIQELQGASLWIIARRELSQEAVEEFARGLGMRPERLRSMGDAIRRARSMRALSRVAIFIDGAGSTDEELANLLSSVTEFSTLGGVVLTWRDGGRASGVGPGLPGVCGLGARPLTSASFFDALIALFGERGASGESMARTQRSLGGFVGAPRILLVEDHPVNRRLGLMLLKSLGLSATVANDGSAAVAAATEGKFDLVLMDCEMPVLDGYEATRRIRSLDMESQPIIVAVTANVGDGEKERCQNAGMNDYLQKPLRLAEFRAVLGKYGFMTVAENQRRA